MKLRGFTIVELLVLIVVIAILFGLSIVGYSGLSNKASVASIQSDLTNAKKALLSFQASSTNGSFPTAINCTNPSSTEICIKPSAGTNFSYVAYNTSINPSFYLTATNGSVVRQVTNISNPDVIPSPVSNGLLLYLDASNPSSYSGTGSTWFDISGNGYNTSLVNGPTFSSANGGLLVFDGIDDYALTPSITGYRSFMIFGSFTNGYGYIVDARSSFSGYVYSGGVGGWQNFIINGYSAAVARSSIPTNQLVSFYTNAPGAYTGALHFMCRYSKTEWLQGNVGVILIYDHVLSQAEITQNLNAFRSRYGI